MNDAGVETSSREGALDRAMVAAGALHGDHEVLDAVTADRAPDGGHSLIERRAMMLDERWGDDDMAVEVREHPLRPVLGAVHGNDPEVLRTDFLHPWGKHAIGFTDVAALARAAARTRAANSSTHEWILR